jgi:cyanophycinase-like exopeptidase
MTAPEVRPLYMLADSQLLFWKNGGEPFLASVFKASANAVPSIAYIGASNGDSPEAYSILNAALEQVEVREVRHIKSAFPDDDREYLRVADVIVLAGGDVEAGWNVITQTGMREVIESRYRDGSAVIVGVSAGAVQCGVHAAVSASEESASESVEAAAANGAIPASPSAMKGNGSSKLINTFGFVSVVIDVHDERDDWATLGSTIHLLEGIVPGIGIPSGGGLIAHTDGTLEPIRHAVCEFTYRDNKLRRAVLTGEVEPEVQTAN